MLNQKQDLIAKILDEYTRGHGFATNDTLSSQLQERIGNELSNIGKQFDNSLARQKEKLDDLADILGKHVKRLLQVDHAVQKLENEKNMDKIN